MTLKRIQHGRGHRYEHNGRAVPGVTTLIGEGFPKPALVDWSARETAGYAVDNWDELGDLGPSERLRTLERARFTRQREAAVRGTEIHDIAARLAAGQEVDVPEPHTGHVDAYLKFADEWQPRELLTETVIWNQSWNYAGTLDLVATLCDGLNWLLDYKTTGKGVFPENALQLAAYRNAEYAIEPDGTKKALPRIDRTGVVWLRADGYDLVPVDAGPDAFYTFICCIKITQFRKLPNDFWIRDAIRPPEKEASAA